MAREMGDETSYREALSEIEAILADLERDAVDVDELALKVARAADLIRVCRSRIADARLQVEEIVADLDEDEPDGEDLRVAGEAGHAEM
jgi:exodeoxyribonuclease VII small subunit